MRILLLSSWVISLLALHLDAFSAVFEISRHRSRITPLYAVPSKSSLYATTTEEALTNHDATKTNFLEPRIVVECQDTDKLESSDEIEYKHDEEGRNDEEEYTEGDVNEDDAELLRRRRMAMAARLLKKGGNVPARSRSASVSESAAKKVAGKQTSVGERRIGSASRARGGRGGLSGSILKGVRTRAAAAAVKKKGDGGESPKGKQQSGPFDMNASTLKQNVIQSTIDAILDAQDRHRSLLENASMSISILGDRDLKFLPKEKAPILPLPHHEIPTVPTPGTELIPRIGPVAITSLQKKDRIKQSISVRVATDADDFKIAQLRLSVFSDFTPEVRRQFCERSCEVLNNRRLKGATCVVASVNYANIAEEESKRGEVISSPHSWILGSAECSTHEFAGTELGMRRPIGSVLYVTEVAVSPRARRCGAGFSLLKGIDELAMRRGVETIYLHVDVQNTAAYNLYEKAGYSKLDGSDPLYAEFTTKLNLHDGATRGRNHYLLEKKITKNQTWLDPAENNKVGTLGFDMPKLGLV